MFKMNTRKTRYVKFVRNSIETHDSACTNASNLTELLSAQYSDRVRYKYKYEVSEEEIAKIDRNEYDLYQFDEVEIDFHDCRWDMNFNANRTGKVAFVENTVGFVERLNKFLEAKGFEPVLALHNKGRFNLSAYTFSNELNKKRKYTTYAILKNSLKFVECDEHKENVLKQDYKLKVFERLYAPAVRSQLANLGFSFRGYVNEYELSNDCKSIVINCIASEAFCNILTKRLADLSKEIFNDKVFNCDINAFLEANNINPADLFESLISDYRSVSFNIPVENIEV